MIYEIDLIKAGDWSQIFKKNNNFILCQCEYNKDLAQEVWIKIFLGIDKFKYGNFRSWAAVITKNLNADFHRAEKRKGIKFFNMSTLFIAKNFVDEIDVSGEIINEKIEHEEKLENMYIKIDCMQPALRDVAILRKTKSCKEIAKITNKSINTILGNMNYVKKNLKKAS